MRILAFDLSLNSTGVTLAVDGQVDHYGLIQGKGNGAKRLKHNRDAVMDKIDACRPDLIVFEDFSFGSDMSFVREIGAMAWMIRCELDEPGYGPFFVVSPMALKKYCVGTAGSKKQKVTKDLILKEVFKRWGHDVVQNDIADSLVLAHIGMAAVGEEKPQIDAQREVLAKIHAANPWLKQMKPVSIMDNGDEEY